MTLIAQADTDDAKPGSAVVVPLDAGNTDIPQPLNLEAENAVDAGPEAEGEGPLCPPKVSPYTSTLAPNCKYKLDSRVNS